MIVFIIAHPDDEAFGPAGTIAKLSETHEVVVAALCKGDKPGKEHVSSNRINAFYQSCKQLNAKPLIFESSDVHLDYHQAIKDIEAVYNEYKPSTIFTHNINDLHIDHRTTAEACMVVARPTPTCSVDNFYMFETPGSSDWAFKSFTPNYFVDVDSYMAHKTSVLELYQTELYAAPDPRSMEGMVNLARFRGQQAGMNHAEAFQQVYARCRKTL